MAIYRDKISGKLVAYFKQKLGAFEYKGGWLKSDCPWCGKENKFGINVGLDKTNCFVCNERVTPFELILKLEGLETKRELYNFLHNLGEVDTFQTKVEKREEKEVELPEGFKLLNRGDGIVANLARRYMEGRGFNVNQLSMKGIGYCMKGKYQGCIILPFFSKGKLVYLIGRKFLLSTAKFRNPEAEEFGVGKAQVIYNSDALYYYKRIQIVESYINSLTLGDRAVAILGKIISDYQKSAIIRSSVEEIDLILDPDAYLHSLKSAMDFSMYKIVRVIRLPEGKDVNDIGKQATKDLIKKVKPQTYHELYKLWLFEKNKLEYEQRFA